MMSKSNLVPLFRGCLINILTRPNFNGTLMKGDGNFYDGWMKNPMSAMISCNDGFRPFSFYIEVIK